MLILELMSRDNIICQASLHIQFMMLKWHIEYNEVQILWEKGVFFRLWNPRGEEEASDLASGHIKDLTGLLCV